MATLEEGERTRVGDGLEFVRARYGRVRRGEAVVGEPLCGGEPPTSPWRRRP